MAYLLYSNAIILMVLGVGLFRRMSLYSPFMLSALVWQVVFISSLIFGDMFYPLTEGAFVMWLTWFLGSSLFYFFLSNPAQLTNKTILRCLPVDYTFILAALILWLAYRIWVVGNAGPSHFFLNLRLSSNQLEDYELLGLVGRSYPLVFALFLFEHVNARNGNRHLRILLWCFMLLYAFATMGKFAILTPVLAWVVIKGIRGELSNRRLLWLVPLSFGLMVLLHRVRAGAGEQASLAELLSIYIYSPIVALGYMVPQIDAPLGAYTLRFFYALVHALMGGMEPVQVIQDYVEIPYLTNVFTVIQPFFVDFGMAGVLFGSAIYGIFFGLTYHYARANRQLPLMIYSGLSVVLVGQFIGELFLTMLSGNLQFIIAAIIVTFFSRRVDFVR